MYIDKTVLAAVKAAKSNINVGQSVMRYAMEPSIRETEEFAEAMDYFDTAYYLLQLIIEGEAD